MRKALTLSNIITFLALVVYLYFFKLSLPHWFHPGWTTDDALQQWFPFHSVYHPEIFKGDFIAELMLGYLAPLHYYLSYFFTWIFESPVVASHYLMLLQYTLTALFLFLAVRKVAAIPAAFLAVLWLFHTREIMQRMAGGLPRSWAGVVFASYLYFVLSKNHKGVLIVFFLGCLTHPPATMLCALSYGLFLLVKVALKETRAEYIKPLKILLLLSPLYIIVTYKIVERPPEVGQMIGPTEAYDMPQLQRATGRFPFLPLLPAIQELRMFGFQAFVGRLYNPGNVLKRSIRIGVVISVILLFIIGVIRKRSTVPLPLFTFFLSIFLVYFASRQVVFKLYVPDRHILLPLVFFFIPFFTIALWRNFHSKEDVSCSKFSGSWKSLIAVAMVVGVSFVGSGTGLYGDGNFNYSSTKKGKVFHWIKENTPEDALFAGHPTYIDSLMLFGMRRALATTEVYHPFYKGYLEYIEPRLLVSLKAHYSRNLNELVETLSEYKVDFFIFERKRFYPESLAKEKYFEPLHDAVKEMTSRDYTEYAYRELPTEIDIEKYPFMPFRDSKSVVIDIKKLKSFLSGEVLE